MSATFDTSDFDNKSASFLKKLEEQSKKGVEQIGDEVMRLSALEVPLDEGGLLESGSVQPQGDGTVIVGYNKVYAARLHENPQYKFQNGRKGKYLEDPIRLNLDVFRNFFKEAIRQIL